MDRKSVITIGRMLVSGVFAWIVLTLFCWFYYNVPVHYENENGATDYVWESNAFHSRATEGFAYGRTNNEGLNNLYDYSEGMKVDVLIMGSSHMEAYNVGMRETTASRLDAMLDNDAVYNIGVSGHRLVNCVANLEDALDRYKPTKWVVIETRDIEFTTEEMEAVISGTLEEIPSHTGSKLLVLLQKNPFLRLAYKQLNSFIGNDIADKGNIEPEFTSEQNLETLRQFIEKVATVIREREASLSGGIIVVYHPGITVLEDGKLRLENDKQKVELFSQLCNENGIRFLDMSSRFESEYADDYTLPYGFSNSAVGSGHINKYGHKMLAEEIYKLIKGME